jgi:hypothetical protein
VDTAVRQAFLLLHAIEAPSAVNLTTLGVLCQPHQSSRCGKQGGTGGQALDCTGTTLAYD